jgi:hypothetical protein
MRTGALAAGLRLSPADRWRALEAVVQLTRASLQLALLPSARTVGLLGSLGSGAPVVPVGAGSLQEAEHVGRTVAAVARRLPWHPTCLRQALAAQRMLRRRDIAARLHLGVAAEPSGSAHAWVTVDGRPVVGRRGLERYVGLAAFE